MKISSELNLCINIFYSIDTKFDHITEPGDDVRDNSGIGSGTDSRAGS